MTTLIFSITFGSIGLGYFIYGKKQQRLVTMLAGMGLCMFPYFIPNPNTAAIVGATLLAMPWLLGES